MGKRKTVTVVSKCQCSVCGQVAFVVPGVEHHHCHGIKLRPGMKLPPAFSDLRKPDSKGKWAVHVEAPYTQAEVDAGVAAMEQELAAQAPALQIAKGEPVTLNPEVTHPVT